MWSKSRTNSTNCLSIKLRYVRMVRLFYVKYTKMLSFFVVAEALMGMIYHRPLGENSSFQFSSLKTSDLFGLIFSEYVTFGLKIKVMYVS